MAASANPPAHKNDGATTTNNNVSKGGCAAVPENSAVGLSEGVLQHNHTLSAEWTRDEQSLLEELLARYASDSRELRFAKIAKILQTKSVRDVALRCRWMNKKENGKHRKDDYGSSRRHRDKREKIAEQVKPSSHAANLAHGLPYTQSSDSDDVMSYKAIGGPSGQLLEQNARALDQISANFSAFKIHENINLFAQTRNNILAILNNINDMPEVMKQMPPLPVKLNDELASSILPRL